MITALQSWSAEERIRNPNVVRIGYFGSLVHGNYGVGSDADIVVVVKESAREWVERPLDFEMHGVPVSVDLLVYTENEWVQIVSRGDRFAQEMKRVVWL